MPRQANTSAAASGIAASRAAMAARWRVASTIRYWAVKLTAAAAAARTHSPAAAWRSHRPERSLDHRGGAGWLPWPGAGATGRDMITRRPDVGRWPVMSWLVPAPGRVTAGIATVMSDRSRGRIGVLVFVAADCGGADADSGQSAGYRLDAGARAVPGTRRDTLQMWATQELPQRFAWLLPVTEAVARQWGRMSAQGRAIGRELPVTDGLLLATARTHDLIFATRNERDCADRDVRILNPWRQAR